MDSVLEKKEVIMKVILESPFAGKSKWYLIRKYQEFRNINYARKCMRDSLLRNEYPIASHLLYTQKGILDDTIPEERKLGILAGLAWGKEAEKTVIYTDYGISSGMEWGVKSANENNRTIEYRQIL